MKIKHLFGQVKYFELFSDWYDGLLELKRSEHNINDLITRRNTDHDLAKLHTPSEAPASGGSSRTRGREDTQAVSGAALVRRMSNMGKSINRNASSKSIQQPIPTGTKKHKSYIYLLQPLAESLI